LAKLEEIVSVRLLDRTSRRVSLTRSGEDLLEAARNLAVASETASRVAFELGQRIGRVLRAGAAPYTTHIRPRRELINAFSLACPNVILELETGWSPALLTWLDAGHIELCFIMGEIDPARYNHIVLNHCGLALTLPSEHPLAAAPSLSPDAVVPYPVNVYPRGPYPKLWDALYAPLIAAGVQLVEVPDVLDRNRSPDMITAFFDFGEDAPSSPGWVRVPLETATAIPFQLVRRKARLSSAGQKFWELAADLGSRKHHNLP
jgi:DNA-binding transcriptional LysR family regulator